MTIYSALHLHLHCVMTFRMISVVMACLGLAFCVESTKVVALTLGCKLASFCYLQRYAYKLIIFPLILFV